MYLQVMGGYYRNHVEPDVGAVRLSDLTPQRIEKWLLALPEKAGVSPTTANRCSTVLFIMLDWAARNRLVPGNPVVAVEELAERPAERGTLTLAEVKKLFNERTIKRVWNGDRTMYTLHLFLAATGARLGEAQALMVTNVHPTHVVLSHSWDRRAGMKVGTKTGPGRAVPVPAKVSKHVADLVKSLKWREPEDLVFCCSTRQRQPIEHTDVGRALYGALSRIGITPEVRRTRRISTHSWRHFLNSALRAAKTPDALVQRTVGHAAASAMTGHYTQFHVEDYAPVLKVQERILG